MEAIKEVAEVVIPASITGMNILAIVIDPAAKAARVEVYENGVVKTYPADLVDEWAAVSEVNKTIIRTFLKRIVEICLTVDPADITGEAL